MALITGAVITVLLNLWFLLPFISYSVQGGFSIVEPGGIAQIQTYNAFANQLFDFFPNAFEVHIVYRSGCKALCKCL